jgi:hypothetical protein
MLKMLLRIIDVYLCKQKKLNWRRGKTRVSRHGAQSLPTYSTVADDLPRMVRSRRHKRRENPPAGLATPPKRRKRAAAIDRPMASTPLHDERAGGQRQAFFRNAGRLPAPAMETIAGRDKRRALARYLR